MKRINLIIIMTILVMFTGSAFAHTHYGNSNETVTPTQVAPGGEATVAFDYTVWHHHGCINQDTGWRIYLDGDLAASGTDVHPACNNTITYNISQDIAVPANTSTGYHTVKIVTSVDNRSWYSGYTRTSTLPLEVIYIDALVDLDPNVLKLGSKGKWITAYIELPSDYDINDVDLSSVRLEGLIPAVKGEVQGNVLMVKFSRSELQNLIDSLAGEPNEVELSITGDVSTMKFQGSDIIGVNY